jgi:hypothetical protein
MVDVLDATNSNRRADVEKICSFVKLGHAQVRLLIQVRQVATGIIPRIPR